MKEIRSNQLHAFRTTNVNVSNAREEKIESQEFYEKNLKIK